MHRREPDVFFKRPVRPARGESLFALALAWRASGGSVSPFRSPTGLTATASQDGEEELQPDPPLAA